MLGLSFKPNCAVVAGPATWQANEPSSPPPTRDKAELPVCPQPLRLVSNDGFAHRLGTATVIAVVAEAANALAAVKLTL